MKSFLRMKSFLGSNIWLVLFIASLVVRASEAFLFDDLTTKQPTVGSVLTDKHYIILVDMIQQEKELREQYMLQIKQKIIENEAKTSSLESKVNQIDHNNKTVSLETFLKLENAYKSMEQNFISMSKDNTEIKKRMSDVQNINLNLFKENQELKELQNASNIRIRDIEQELQQLKNLKALNELQEIQNIKTDISVLRTGVDGINRKTKSLDLTQRARAQDFMALYNQTIAVKSELPIIKTDLRKINTRQFENEKRLDELNGTIVNDRKAVAITACASMKSLPAMQSVKFESIITSYGIQNTSYIAKQGYYNCELPGLYLVTLTTMTYNARDVYFHIYQNSRYLVDLYVVNNSVDYYGASASVVVQLNRDDKITVKPAATTYIYGDPSRQSTCITIIKIK